ncbi:MAG: hypothetical protein ACR2PL_26330 [Dehalococcoidia bacterium]
MTLTAAADASFDLGIHVNNRRGLKLKNVILPSDLKFNLGAVQYGYAPFFLPGVRLKRVSPTILRGGSEASVMPAV